MNRLLEKIAWKTRRWNLKFSLLNLSHKSNEITFDFVCFTISFRDYSLLSLHFRLPNKTTVKRFVVDSWDFLFLYNFLFTKWERLSDRALWSRNSLSTWEEIQLKILSKIV